jgi:Family of unknown function (DUF6492)
LLAHVLEPDVLMRSVALLTPSHAKDFERCALLCRSIDAFVTGYATHYLIVNDEDVGLFQKLASKHRVIVPASRYLPKWLWAVPPVLQRGSRRVWLSLLSYPVHGWHVQQILKIAGVLAAAEERVCIIDSDNVFFRAFDIGRYAGADKTPLFFDRDAILASSPMHGVWLRNADRLLGLSQTKFPADDFVGNVLVWDRQTARAMTQAIKAATGTSWALALCRIRRFSEYLLYGRFVTTEPAYLATHECVEQSPAFAHWESDRLDRTSIEAMMRAAAPEQAALCIQSYSETSVKDIKDAIEFA